MRVFAVFPVSLLAVPVGSILFALLAERAYTEIVHQHPGSAAASA